MANMIYLLYEQDAFDGPGGRVIEAYQSRESAERRKQKLTIESQSDELEEWQRCEYHIQEIALFE